MVMGVGNITTMDSCGYRGCLDVADKPPGFHLNAKEIKAMTHSNKSPPGL